MSENGQDVDGARQHVDRICICRLGGLCSCAERLLFLASQLKLVCRLRTTYNTFHLMEQRSDWGNRPCEICPSAWVSVLDAGRFSEEGCSNCSLAIQENDH